MNTISGKGKKMRGDDTKQTAEIRIGVMDEKRAEARGKEQK